jgi:aspartyl-tRNA(Asn)/glutamyl-tRNA(Gln) amidotransferase subunit A
MPTSLKQLAALLDAGKTSSVELCQDYLARIQASTLNAFITLDAERTLAEARAADAQRAAGRAGALTGVPVAHKDIFCAEGWRTTCGSKMLANFVAPYDAHVISHFKAAGMPCLGKTNMDEFAMGSSNETSFFGAVKNPWDTSRVPGGSSGGSAAAVAARLAPAATGTDTGGSIRQPAAFTGITGIKPSYGMVSRYGMIAFASSLDQGGPMAPSAEDCALLLNVMTGFDARDSTSLQRDPEDYARDLDRPLAGLRVGVPAEFFAAGLDAEVATAVRTALDELARLGATLVEVHLPHAHLAIPVYYVIAPAEASSNLSRFDGVRYGHRATDYANLDDMYCKTRAQGFGAEVKRRIMIGAYVLSHGYYDAYYVQAQKVRRLIAADFETAFAQCDAIASPTAPGTAFRLGEKTDDPVQMYLNDLYTIPASLAGLPAMSLPCGFDGANLPIGLQLVGPYFSESRLLNVAHQYQHASDWHARLPAGGSRNTRGRPEGFLAPLGGLSEAKSRGNI